MAGYSGTPLAKKLGIAPPMTLLAIEAPAQYQAWIGELPKGVSIVTKCKPPVRAAHVFSTRKTVLERHLAALRRQLQDDGFVWVSWPKKAAKVETDITEDTIRAVALPLGFVDIKVCAVSEVWSGLKLVIRKSERSAIRDKSA